MTNAPAFIILSVLTLLVIVIVFAMKYLTARSPRPRAGNEGKRNSSGHRRLATGDRATDEPA